jgi:penicillin-binding protein 2
MFGGHTVPQPWRPRRWGIMDMRRAIVESSNVYYYSLANEMGVDLMHEQLEPLRASGARPASTSTANSPATAAVHRLEARKYKKPEQQRWYAGETISLGIGQGYNNFTMLQLASATATLVSGGQRFKPRLVREVEDVLTSQRKRVIGDALEPLPFKPEHVEVIRRALQGVAQEGTSARVFAGAGYLSGGKTGTAQAVGARPTRSTTRPGSRSTSATTRCTSPPRRSRRPPWRWR